MKRIKLSIFSSLALVASLISASCSSDVETVAEESAVETTDDGTALEEEVTTSPLITVTINNPSSNTVTYSRSEIQTSDEKDVKDVKFYIFREIDDEFYYYGNPKFTYTADSDNSTYTYTYSIYDDIYLLGETIQVLLVANDSVNLSDTENKIIKDETSIDDFKKSLASASVSSGDNVDVLVGDFPSGSSVTGFPMSATATVTDSDDDEDESAFEVTLDGVELEATLIRTMARVDIRNYVTNLTITDVTVGNTPNKSFLFAQGDETYDEPTTSDDSSFEYVTLKALSAYYNSLEAFIITNTSFVSTDETYGYTDMQQVLYMYEQSCTGTYPTVYISFAIDDTDYTGTVEVSFGKEGIDVIRNYRYIIRLGKEDGDDDSTTTISTTTSATLTFSVEVVDWEERITVEEVLTFDDSTTSDSTTSDEE